MSCRLTSEEHFSTKNIPRILLSKEISRDRPINRTYQLIAHSTSDFDDRLQFYKIDYFKFFEKMNCILETAFCSSKRLQLSLHNLS